MLSVEINSGLPYHNEGKLQRPANDSKLNRESAVYGLLPTWIKYDACFSVR
jgi:hypothetical protein